MPLYDNRMEVSSGCHLKQIDNRMAPPSGC